MSTRQDDKAMRLHTMLEEVLKPVMMKLESLEEEVAALRKRQEELILEQENNK
ncbi:hypothetical protein [Thalassobacillus devorans]|uniref:hypothetical protein n=1 Tax=Thalassobacillus devorans TaxID=279813 RepID=UPI0004BA282D|nr:hypothetical protein [Thalassobacillus devorans]